MTIIDHYFGQYGAGSFESALFQAWRLASFGNRRALENAFPDYFPVARMYGIAPFYGWATHTKFTLDVMPHIVKMNQWGKMVEAVRLPWSEIKKRTHTPCLYPTNHDATFESHERSFGTFIDPATGKEVNCLCFGDYTWGDNILWYVTEEKLEDIIRQEQQDKLQHLRDTEGAVIFQGHAYTPYAAFPKEFELIDVRCGRYLVDYANDDTDGHKAFYEQYTGEADLFFLDGDHSKIVIPATYGFMEFCGMNHGKKIKVLNDK